MVKDGEMFEGQEEMFHAKDRGIHFTEEKRRRA
jgi:hypothetical protein